MGRPAGSLEANLIRLVKNARNFAFDNPDILCGLVDDGLLARLVFKVQCLDPPCVVAGSVVCDGLRVR